MSNQPTAAHQRLQGGGMPQDPFMVVIVTFEPEGSGTRHTARVRHWSAETRKRHEAMGFHEG